MPPLSRRTLLQGFGVSLALPLLESMGASRLFAAKATAAAPVRMAFMYVPNGMNMDSWTPTAEGTGYELPWTLEPLQGLKSELNVLTGLTQQKAAANGDGGGDHARALATFLTGTQARKTDGADIRAGVSVDQLAAQELAKFTRFPSLEIGCDPAAMVGNCDSGYSCAYSSNISWKSESQPVPKETDPKLIFERLFSNGRTGESEAARGRREKYSQSVLDFVTDDAKRLSDKVSGADRRKLDEYMTAVREIEQRIAKSREKVDMSDIDMKKPTGTPKNNAEHIRLLGDLMVLAFQTDTTRVSTFVFANEGSNRSYPEIGVSEGHHELSHHQRKAEKLEGIRKINRYHVEQFAYVINKLKETKEGEGTLLDNSMVIYGSGIGDGDAHNHDNLPIVMAGRAGGAIDTGRHIKFENDTPMTNLYLSMLDLVGAKVESLGDSNGRLKGLKG
jgi:Protein of unknown function (DUF1552)